MKHLVMSSLVLGKHYTETEATILSKPSFPAITVAFESDGSLSRFFTVTLISIFPMFLARSICNVLWHL